MEGTAFFPVGVVDGKSKLCRCLESGLPVFSRDVGTAGEKGFFACGYEHFVGSLYKKPYMKNCYEVLQFNLPTKLFFDFDMYVGDDFDSDKAHFETFFKDFLRHVVKDIGERWGVGSGPKYITLDASTPTKLSRHVIFDFFLFNMQHVKDYVDYLTGNFDGDCTRVVDLSIYTNNRSFRLVYSSKMGKDNSLLPFQTQDVSYSEILVMESMVQARAPDHYSGRWNYLRGEIHSFYPPRGQKRQRGAVTSLSILPEESVSNYGQVRDFIESLGGNIRSARRDGTFVNFIVSSLVCPWIGRVHKHNNTFFTINTSVWTGWFKCADQDCPALHYKKTNLIWTLT